jgi:hypothetical protein
VLYTAIAVIDGRWKPPRVTPKVSHIPRAQAPIGGTIAISPARSML